MFTGRKGDGRLKFKAELCTKSHMAVQVYHFYQENAPCWHAIRGQNRSKRLSCPLLSHSLIFPLLEMPVASVLQADEHTACVSTF